MSFLDKIQFWKREPAFSVPPEHDFDFTKPIGDGYPDTTGLGQPTFGNTPFQQNQMPQLPSFELGFGNAMQPSSLPQLGSSMNPPQMASGSMVSKDIEIISAKIDSLRATMESVNQRLMNIERLAQNEKQPDYGRRTQW